MVDFLIRFGQWGMVAGAAEGIGAAFCEELARHELLTRILPRSLSAALVNRTMRNTYSTFI